MDIPALLDSYRLDDTPILCHCFRQNMRDYELQAYLHDQPQRGLYEFVFRGCVEAHTTLVLPPERFSMDQALLSGDETAPASGRGFFWGHGWTCARSGWRYHAGSALAQRWSQQLGLTMHELEIETDVYRLRLIFHDLQICCLEDESGRPCLSA